MRRIQNPPNPYLSEHREWLGPPPRVRLEVYEERARSILSQNDSPDVPFRWSVNPYRGCQHACAYCYARPTHEYLGLGAGSDFDSKIIVKINAPELLAQAFARRTWRREPVAFSGVTDCYQPLEAAWKLTRRCLEVCRDFANPANVITKSILVMRDAELLAELNARCHASVYISIPFADDRTARKIEWGAPPPTRRFEALRRLHEAGVPVGILIAPIIPGLNDRDVPTLLEKAADCGAASAGYIPLRLPGNVADVFLSRLKAEMPEAAGRIEARIRDMRGGRINDSRFGCRMGGVGVYWQSVQQLFETSAARHGLRSQSSSQNRGHTPPKQKGECAPDGLVGHRGSTLRDSNRGSRQLPLFANLSVRE